MTSELFWAIEPDEEVVPERVRGDSSAMLLRRRLARGTLVDMAHLGDAAELLEGFSVGEALRDRGITVARTASVASVFEALGAGQGDPVVVIDANRRPVGTIDQEYLCSIPEETAGFRAADVMTALVVLVHDHANAFSAAQLMRDSRVDQLVVVNALGCFEGVLSAEDLFDLAF